jgi:MinD superfamily P-loop ATPase
MIVSVASGKGGTGKTTVAVNLALFLDKKFDAYLNFRDCDVEEPNAHIFLKPKINKKIHFGIPIPEVNFSKCDYCGVCSEVCAFNAIVVVKEEVLVFPELCHGCGGCTLLCPQKAIREKNRTVGVVEEGICGGMKFIHGKLNVGEMMATPLIKFVKEKKIFGEVDEKTEDKNEISIVDVPPGTSCPVIEAVSGSDFTILVTEPTPFGLNDLELAVETLRKLGIPFGVVINRAGTGDRNVYNYCDQEGVPIIAEIPFERDIAVLYSHGIPIIKEGERFNRIFADIWSYVSSVSNFVPSH